MGDRLVDAVGHLVLVRPGIARCSGEVPMKVWMRGECACRTASQQRSISLRLARASPQIVAFRLLRDLGHGAEIALGGDGKARLDDIHAHLVEQPRDLELFLVAHGGAGALLAVAQRGVENHNPVFVASGETRSFFASGEMRSLVWSVMSGLFQLS